MGLRASRSNIVHHHCLCSLSLSGIEFQFLMKGFVLFCFPAQGNLFISKFPWWASSRNWWEYLQPRDWNLWNPFSPLMGWRLCQSWKRWITENTKDSLMTQTSRSYRTEWILLFIGPAMRDEHRLLFWKDGPNFPTSLHPHSLALLAKGLGIQWLNKNILDCKNKWECL